MDKKERKILMSTSVILNVVLSNDNCAALCAVQISINGLRNVNASQFFEPVFVHMWYKFYF